MKESNDAVNCILNIRNFGGPFGWYIKKVFPRFSSFAYINANFLLRRRRTNEYIKWFLDQPRPPKPLSVEIETINRCNSTCEFCPANKNNDKRPFAKMQDEVFYKIVEDLKCWNYRGLISLYANNEPFVDNRIIDFHRLVRAKLPDCRIKFFTNGMLMTLEKFKEIIQFVDYMVINNYNEKMQLNKNVKAVINEIKDNRHLYRGKEIIVNYRYIKDILTNRAGEAPNKKAGEQIITEPCIMPFTDLVIFSNAVAGICCNDATEKSNLGNVKEMSLQSIWENQYGLVREKIKKGRNGYALCRYCDTIDSGFRLKQIAKSKD